MKDAKNMYLVDYHTKMKPLLPGSIPASAICHGCIFLLPNGSCQIGQIRSSISGKERKHLNNGDAKVGDICDMHTGRSG